MMYLVSILGFFLVQAINLSIQDLFDSSWSVSGWTATTTGGTTTNPYTTITSQCNNQNMLKLSDSYLTYQKTYSITDYEYYQLYIDLELYFYIFTQTSINIYVNSNLIYSQAFTNSILTINNICNTGTDSQYIIYQGFYTTQQTLQILIQYTQNVPNSNSYIGIKNLNIYSNGIPLIGGCPMNLPLLSAGTCVAQCTISYPYLTGQYINQCVSGFNISYGLIRYYYTTGANFVISNSPPNSTVSAFFDGSNKLLNSNLYTGPSSIFHSNLFTNQFQSASPIYQANFNGQGTDKFQFCFVFYAFGTWDDGSFVKIYIAGSSIYKNNMVSISKTQGKLISSTQSNFYDTNVTYNGVQQVAKKTLITFAAHYYGANTVQFCFTQVLQGNTASYGFGDVVFYKTPQDPNFNFPANTDIYGLPYTCTNGLYAYNGTCATACPIYSFTSNSNYNCTDYAISESSIYNPAFGISYNAYGTYIVKMFHQNNFQQSDIDSLFQTKPPAVKNYLNSESYSFLKSMKILGGYNSWGYGTYQATFSNLIAHYQVRLFFTLYLIDGWQTGDTFAYSIDGTIVDTFTKNPTIQLQGLSTLDTKVVISGRKFYHGSSTLSLSFNCNIAQKDSSKASCGIQNLFVLLDQNVNILCPLSNQFFSYTTQNCETCINSPCSLFPTNQITAKCSIGCLTCTSDTICNTCDIQNGYQISGNQCVCKSNYIMVSSFCQKCYYQCTTCSGTSSNQCSTCDSSRTISGGVCSCNLGYYDSYSISTCQVCDVSCLTCNAAGNTSCSSCDSAKNRSTLSSGSCPCDAGYNDVQNPGYGCLANYSPCHYSCQTCYGALASNCITCSAADFRALSTATCLCNTGYYDVYVATCVPSYSPCFYQCLLCFGPSNTQCIQCPSGRNKNVLTAGSNIQCLCNPGYYDNLVVPCVACDLQCVTCIGAGSSNCSSCDATKHRSYTSRTCPCSTGYNDILNPGNACVANYTPCYQNCLTCYGALINNCLTCDSSNHRILSSYSCLCDTGYTDIGLVACSFNYAPCHFTCLTCFGAASSQCSTCGQKRTLTIVSLGIDSSCPCSISYYAYAQTCLACNATCITCNGGLTTNCTSCDSSLFRQLDVNQCICINNYNEMLNPGTCVANYNSCHNTCTKCFGSSNTQCIECQSNRSIISNTCPCSIGYNEILNPGTCVLNYTPCNQQCDSCYGALNNNCISCNGANFRIFDTNTNTCPCDGSHIDIGQVLCVSQFSHCYSSCLTCFGGQIYECLTCSSTRTLSIVSSFNQVCNCKPKYYEVSGASDCSPCYYTCASCNGSTNLNCQSCNANRSLATGQCPCIANYNDLNGSLSDCQQNYSSCHLSCMTCFGGNQNQCLTCQSGSLRTYNNTNYTCDCPSGYDGSSSVCTLSCHNTCLTCSGPNPTDCLTCDTTRQLQSTSCICNVGTNDRLNPPTCVADLTSCFAAYILTCFGNASNQALSCDSNLNRILNVIICSCKGGFYEDSSTHLCVQCNPSCKTCNWGTNQSCLTCDTTMNRVAVRDSSNSCPCLTNYNDKLNLDYACVADLTQCHYSCQTCFGSANNQCLTCPTSSFRTFTNYECSCNQNYGDAGSALCVLCDLTCQTCNGGNNNNCLSCDSTIHRTLSGSICVCSLGYNSLANVGSCTLNYSPCHHSCDVCYGASFNQCVSCGLQNTYHRVYQVDHTCPCDTNYIDQNSQQICVLPYYPCHFSCNQCYGSTLNDCANCSPTSNRTFSSGKCLCNNGYNDALNQQVCQLNYTPCDPTCFTCFGGSSTQCLTCHFPLSINTNVCQCPTVTDVYLNNVCHTLVTPCHISCLTCIDNSNIGCYKCVNYRAFQNYGGNFVCNCIDGYFEDTLNSNNCSQCHHSCQTCETTITNCLSCSAQQNRQLLGNSCPCIQNYQEVNRNCVSCVNADCLTCDSQQQCLTCVSSLKQLSNGLCTCIEGYYQLQNDCHECDNTCLSCDGAGKQNCLNCDSSKNRIITSGQCTCITGYQENNYRQCVDCISEEGILLYQCQYKNSTDGVWNYGEQCDDGNNDARDGCYNQIIQSNFSCTNIINMPSICYKCPDHCLNCFQINNQIICISCQEYYFSNQVSCIKCADVQCKNCQSLTQCLVCSEDIVPQDGKCFNCEQGFYQIDAECQSKCGDGIKTLNEQCDDGNNQSGDGCNDQCCIEENFICETAQLQSNCFVQSPPKLLINQKHSLLTNMRQFTIQSDQNVYQKDIHIDAISQEQDLIFQYLIPKQYNLTILNIDVNISFQKSFDNIEIRFYVGGQIYNNMNQNVSNRYLVLNIENIIVMSQQESQISTQVSKMTQGITITFASVSLFQLLLGGAQQFIQFLNMIQKLKYLKYINIEFPPNLDEFLQIFDGFSIQPFIQFAQIENIFGEEQIPFVETSNKFQQNGVNAYFFSNIQDYFLTLLSGVLLNYLFELFVRILENSKSIFGYRSFFIMKQLYSLINKIQRLLINSIKIFKKYGVMQLTIMSCFDIQFAILIQLSVQNYDDPNLAINCVLAYGFIIFYIFVIVKCLSFKDEECNSQIIWQSTFGSIRVVESGLFMMSIVSLQYFPQCQVIIISLSSLSISLYVLTFKPLKDNLNNYKFFIQESALFVTNFSFVGYIYFPTKINQIDLGWFQIASYGSMILANLLIELYSSAKVLKIRFQSNQKRQNQSPRPLL